MKFPVLYTYFRLKPVKGVLLYGPPGCSKTMTAKAAARESGLNFITVKGPELMSMYVGESERALREVFRKARAVRPSIVFFDEIDAIGAAKASSGGVHTVTTLLNELDGFNALEGVFVLAATNRPEILDPALIRAGRLTTLYVGLPDTEARREIIIRLLAKLPVEDIGEYDVVQATKGFSGAEIVAICEKACSDAMEIEIHRGDDRSMTPLVTQMQLENAIKSQEKSVTKTMEEDHRKWGAARH